MCIRDRCIGCYSVFNFGVAWVGPPILQPNVLFAATGLLFSSMQDVSIVIDSLAQLLPINISHLPSPNGLGIAMFLRCSCSALCWFQSVAKKETKFGITTASSWPLAYP